MRKTWKMRAAALLLTAVCTVGASFAAYADDVPSGPASDMELIQKGQVSGTHAKHPVREKVSDRSSENTPHGLNKQNLATILFSRLIIFHKFAADSSAESLRVVSGESCLYREDVYKRLSFVFQNFAVFFISPER